MCVCVYVGLYLYSNRQHSHVEKQKLLIIALDLPYSLGRETVMADYFEH